METKAGITQEAFHICPNRLNEIIIRRVWGQEDEGDLVNLGELAQPFLVMEACIIHNDHITNHGQREQEITKPILEPFRGCGATITIFAQYLPITIPSDNIHAGELPARYRVVNSFPTQSTPIFP